jgi:chromosome segregation ATPase
VKEALAALAEQLETSKRAFEKVRMEARDSYSKVEQKKNVLKRTEDRLRDVRNDIKKQNNKKKDFDTELNDIREAGRIDTTSLEEEEVSE